MCVCVCVCVCVCDLTNQSSWNSILSGVKFYGVFFFFYKLVFRNNDSFYSPHFPSISKKDNPRRGKANVHDYELVVSELELELFYYDHFRTKHPWKRY